MSASLEASGIINPKHTATGICTTHAGHCLQLFPASQAQRRQRETLKVRFWIKWVENHPVFERDIGIHCSVTCPSEGEMGQKAWLAWALAFVFLLEFQRHCALISCPTSCIESRLPLLENKPAACSLGPSPAGLSDGTSLGSSFGWVSLVFLLTS